MSTQRSPAGSCSARAVFLLGADRAATALFYRLLCLHPQIAYVCRFERHAPWLPFVAGRIRLRRFSSKLRWWFREPRASRMVRAVMRQLEPAPDDAFHRRLGLGPAPVHESPAESVAERVRNRFSGLQQAAGCRLLVTHGGLDEVAALEALFPEARYLVLRSDDDGVDAAELPRKLAAIGPERVRTVQYRNLVEEPLEVMRQVLTFLGLERRLDYEWALKALNLPAPAARQSSVRAAASPQLEADEPLGPPGYVS